jgi:2-keto-3-deoxy-L-fuconate dehydrogenase
MFSLANKVAVITGGGSGIGQAAAKMFAQQGATVHIIDLNADQAVETTRMITAEGGQARMHTADVSNQQQIKDIVASLSRVDILINNAGIAHIGRADNTSEEDFDRIYRVNVKGAYNCLHAVLPVMIKQKGGAILNLASIASHVGLTDRFAYSMSKGAMHAMTLSVARDYIQYGIRCNSISPARVHTPFVDGFIAKNYPGQEAEIFDKLSKSQPIGRMGTPTDLASLMLYLCSDEASFITGSDYAIDGGFITLNT